MDFEFLTHPKGDWRRLSSEDFFEYLLNEYQPLSSSTDSSMEDRFRALDAKLFEMDYRNPKCFNALFLEVTRLLNMSSSSSSTRVAALCAILTDRLPRVPYASKKLFLHMKSEDFQPTHVEDWFARAQEELKLLHQAVVKVESFGVQVGTKPAHNLTAIMNKPIPKREPREEVRSVQKDRKEKRKDTADTQSCKVCGRDHHTPSTCQFNVEGHKHPDINKTELPWAESPNGKAWEAKGHKTLPFNETLSGVAWQAPPKASKDKKMFSKKQKKCENCLNYLQLHETQNDLLDGELKLSNSTMPCTLLLDTGALHGNYINADVASRILKENKNMCREKKRKIQGAFKQSQSCSSLECEVDVHVTNESENKQQVLSFTAAVIDSQQDIIIGRQTIKDNAVVGAFPSHFMHSGKSPQQHKPYDDPYQISPAAGRVLCKHPGSLLHGQVEREERESGQECVKIVQKRVCTKPRGCTIHQEDLRNFASSTMSVTQNDEKERRQNVAQCLFNLNNHASILKVNGLTET